MKVLILKGDQPRHNYFASELLKTPGIEFKVIMPLRLEGKRLKKMFLRSPRTFFSRVTKYMMYFLIKGWKREREFFGDNPVPGEEKVLNINAASTVGIIRDFQPELILAFGVPVVTESILAIPTFGAINLHGGISPDYKGGNTIFWPLFHRRPEMAGATLHYMVRKVDSGKVVARIYPDISENDNEISISCKTFKYATAEMVRLLQWIRDKRSPVPGREQEHNGHLYLARHRTLWKDITGVWKIRRNLKGVSLILRIERFYP